MRDILDGVHDIAFTNLTAQDVVRHKLVGRIVDAYESYDSNGLKAGGGDHERRRTR